MILPAPGVTVTGTETTSVSRTRRSFVLRLGAAATALTAGCASSSPSSTATSAPDTAPPTPGSETATPFPTLGPDRSRCPLSHSLLSDPSGSITARYDYAELSSAAKAVFEAARDSDGETYRVEARASNNPPEFRYGDVVDYYEIEYQGEVYVLGTWGGSPLC